MILIALVAAGALAVGSVVQGDDEDSSRVSLEAELQAILDQVEAPEPVDPFLDGGRPDLAILSSNTVMGEVGPCG